MNKILLLIYLIPLLISIYSILASLSNVLLIFFYGLLAIIILASFFTILANQSFRDLLSSSDQISEIIKVFNETVIYSAAISIFISVILLGLYFLVETKRQLFLFIPIISIMLSILSVLIWYII